MQAVIVAGQCEYQLSPLTDTVAPPLLLIEQEPLLHFLLKRLEAAGINEVIIAAGSYAPEISALIFNRDYRAWIQTVPQSERLGDGSGLKRLARLLHGSFLVVHSDAYFDCDLKPMVQAHFHAGAAITLSLSPGSAVSINQLAGDNVSAADLAAAAAGLSGIFIVEPELLETIPADVSYDVRTDLLPRLIAAGVPINLHQLSGCWVELGSIERYLDAQAIYLDAVHPRGFVHPAAAVASTARLIEPFYIGAGTRIEHRATVGPYTVVAGKGVIGADARVAGAMLYPGSNVGAHSQIEQAVLGPDVQLQEGVTVSRWTIIGEGARIMSDSVLAEHSKVAPRWCGLQIAHPSAARYLSSLRPKVSADNPSFQQARRARV